MAGEEPGTPPEPRYGWVIVAVSMVMAGVGSGSMAGIAVFVTTLVAELGWLRGQTTFAYLAGATAMGLGGIGMGWLADRYGSRVVVVMGSLVAGSAYLLLSRVSALWQFYLLFLMLGGLGASVFDAPLVALVGNWFQRRKGLALGLTMAGRSFGLAGVPVVAALLIGWVGWRGAYLGLGFFTFLVITPLALLLRPPPQPGAAAIRRPGAAGEAEEPPFNRVLAVGWIGVATIFCCTCMSTLLVHVVPLAQDAGHALQPAAGILGVVAVAAFFGRILVGWISDRIGPVRTYLLGSLVQTALVFWFTQLQALSSFYGLAVLFGIGYGGTMTSAIISVQEFAPAHRRGLAQGVVLFLAWLGMGLGGWQGGFFFDATGAYTIPFANAALAGVVNLAIVGALLLWLSRRGRDSGPWVPQLAAGD